MKYVQDLILKGLYTSEIPILKEFCTGLAYEIFILIELYNVQCTYLASEIPILKRRHTYLASEIPILKGLHTYLASEIPILKDCTQIWHLRFLF